MTGYPEAVLAAELAIPYAAVALITDYDVGLADVDGTGVDGIEPVTEEMVFSFFEGNIERVRASAFRGDPAAPVGCSALPPLSFELCRSKQGGRMTRLRIRRRPIIYWSLTGAVALITGLIVSGAVAGAA